VLGGQANWRVLEHLSLQASPVSLAACRMYSQAQWAGVGVAWSAGMCVCVVCVCGGGGGGRYVSVSLVERGVSICVYFWCCMCWVA
jgi:hypothetical protein